MEKANSGNRLIYYLSLVGFFAIFSTTISKSPVLPLFANSLGADATVIGLIAALSPLAGVIFSFPIGVLSDNYGRRKLLIASGAVFLVAPLLYLFVANAWYLIPIRFFHGAATAILGPVVSAIIAERYSKNKGEMLGWYSSSTLIGRTIAPLIGGFVISYFAASQGMLKYQFVYLIAFAASIPVFLLILTYKETRSKPVKSVGFGDFKRNLAEFFSSPALRGAALVDLSTYFTYGAFETYLPLFLIANGVGASGIGMIFSVQVLMIAFSKPMFGKLADTVDKRIQIVVGLLLMGGSVAAVPFFSDFWAFIILSMIAGIGLSLSSVATAAYVAEVSKPETLGASMGALSSTMDIGQSSGPLITGIIIASFNYEAGFFASFVLAAIVAALFLLSVYGKHELQRKK